MAPKDEPQRFFASFFLLIKVAVAKPTCSLRKNEMSILKGG